MPFFPVNLLAVFVGLVIVTIVLLDTFETIVLPRTVSRAFRLTRLFYRTTWWVWTEISCRVSNAKRETLLGFYGPLSLLVLLAVWAAGLVMGFGLIHWGCYTQFRDAASGSQFFSYIYFSGVTFFTLGFGDLAPANVGGRIISVVEAGVGFGFLGIVIGYLPVLYQSFSKREVGISMLDSRASSPPSGIELLRRHADHMEELTDFLAKWEEWGAEVLESHLSYPILIFYRSQHDRQSWIGAMTAIMDACAIISLGFEGDPPWQTKLLWQAERTFAISRHAVVDLSLILYLEPIEPHPNRLAPDRFPEMVAILAEAGLTLKPDAEDRLQQIRCGYESYINALGQRLSLPLPPWFVRQKTEDNWLSGVWESRHHFFDEEDEPTEVEELYAAVRGEVAPSVKSGSPTENESPQKKELHG